jgi:hypothetical protein
VLFGLPRLIANSGSGGLIEKLQSPSTVDVKAFDNT